MPYLQLSERDVAFDVMNRSLDHDRRAWVHTWDMLHAWTPEGGDFRNDPRFAKLAARVGLLDYWKQYGYPDGCRSGSDAPIVCS